MIYVTCIILGVAVMLALATILTAVGVIIGILAVIILTARALGWARREQTIRGSSVGIADLQKRRAS